VVSKSNGGIKNVSIRTLQHLPEGTYKSSFTFTRKPAIDCLMWETVHTAQIDFGTIDSLHILGEAIGEKKLSALELKELDETEEEATTNFLSRFYISRKNRIATVTLNFSQLQVKDSSYDFVIIIRTGTKSDRFTFLMKNATSYKVEKTADVFNIYPI
jgi:hypothetical protein